MNYKKWKKEFHSVDTLICECASVEHQIVFRYLNDDNELYAEIFLHNHDNFFKRLWTAIRYVFGYKCKYGEWDSIIISENNKHQFQKALDKIKEE